MSASRSEHAGRFAFDGIDRVLHEKARLGILSALLARAEGLRFGELRELCSLTDGNLSRHVQVLYEAELVEVWKGFEGRRPQTLVRLSREGRSAFLAYLDELEGIVRGARRARRGAPRRARRREPPAGWVPA